MEAGDDDRGMVEHASSREVPPRSSITRNIGSLLASQLTTWLLATLLAVIQPRFLGPSAQGELRLTFSLWTIAQVVIGLGTSMYLTLQVARHRRDGLALLGPVFVLRALTFSGASLVLAGYVWISGSDQRFAALMAVYGVAVLFSVMGEALVAAFVGLERMSIVAWAAIVSKVFGTVVAIAVLLAGGDALDVVFVSAGSNAVSFLILAIAYRSVGTVEFGNWRLHRRNIIAGSSAFLVTGLVLSTYQQIDTVIMSVLVENDALGWYSAAETLSGSLAFLPAIVMSSLFPVIGRLFRDDPTQVEPLIRRTSYLLLLVAVPLSLGTVVVAMPLTPILYGDAFVPAGQVLTVFGIVNLFSFGTVVFGTIALATERQRFWNLVMVAAIIATIPLDLVLVPWADRRYGNGAIGGAIAFVLTEAAMFAVGLWRVAPFLVERSFVCRAARTAAAGGFMFALAWPLRSQPVVVPIAVGAVAYLGGLLLLRVPDDEDWRRLRSLIRRPVRAR